MGTNLYYFSATGNSLFAAKALQKRIPDCSLQSIIKTVENTVVHPDSTAVGLVFPVYFSGMPTAVESFIRKIDFSGVDYIFVAATKSQFTSPGTIATQINAILKSANKKASAVFYIDMVGNNIQRYNILDIEKQKAANQKTLTKCDRIAGIVQNKQSVFENPVPLLNFAGRKMYTAWEKSLPRFDRAFTADKCNSCNLCVRICPAKNISLTSSGPEWHHHCGSCFACIHICPARAIQFGKNTLNRNRYRNPEIKVEELLLR
jgi:formate hydrogenlyase subunit 6/NADH:ubiquinone oxidoreductase subunit I